MFFGIFTIALTREGIGIEKCCCSLVNSFLGQEGVSARRGVEVNLRFPALRFSFPSSFFPSSYSANVFYILHTRYITVQSYQ